MKHVMEEKSVFQDFFEKPDRLIDRKIEKRESGVDVIIPIFNTNELFERNLFNIYKVIPVNRLLIGDGGCTDSSIHIVKKFPRVTILDQRNFDSLGYAIKDLIENVETEWFIYLHADVFLSDNWYEEMSKHKNEYDFFECLTRHTVIMEYVFNDYYRPSNAGSQFGRKAAFEKILPLIDDDYVYRNEDYILVGLLEKFGGTYGRVSDTFTYHQVMNKRGEKEPKLEKIKITKKTDRDWEVRTYNMQARGLVKYLLPEKQDIINITNQSIARLNDLDHLEWNEFKEWIKITNSEWLKYIKNPNNIKYKIRKNLIRILKKIYKKN